MSEKVYPNQGPTITTVAYPSSQFNQADDRKQSHPSAAAMTSSPRVQSVSYPVASPYAQNGSYALQEREGCGCFGCCCDYRRAVIICSIIVMILELIGIILIATGAADLYFDADSEDEDEIDEHMEKYELIEIIFSAVTIVISVGAIFGAIYYNVYLVALNAFWLLVGYIVGVVLVVRACNEWEDKGVSYECDVNVPALVIAFVITGFWIYPNVGFIVEVKKGILTEETYAREEYSCCCV